MMVAFHNFRKSIVYIKTIYASRVTQTNRVITSFYTSCFFFFFFPRMMIYDIFWSKCKVVYLNPFTNFISVIFPKSYFTGYPCFLDLDSTWSKSYMHWNQTDCWYKVEEKIDNLWDNESLLEAAKERKKCQTEWEWKFGKIWGNERVKVFLTS